MQVNVQPQTEAQTWTWTWIRMTLLPRRVRDGQVLPVEDDEHHRERSLQDSRNAFARR